MWLDALAARHAGAMTRPEFLKAIRALSARYVERRGAIADRSPLDSAGKRAAFAGFYAPLHFLTARAIVRALDLSAAPVDTIVDLGCGTGVAGLAWATAMTPQPALVGVDASAWALAEARGNWEALGCRGRAARHDLVAELESLARARGARQAGPRLGVVLGWSLNELPAPARAGAERALFELAARGARVLVMEPIARALLPWWDAFADRAAAAGGRCDEWRFADPLPGPLAQLDRDAGFSREELTARSVSFHHR